MALELFAKLHQRSRWCFLQQFPTPQAAQAASVEALTTTLKQAGHPAAAKVALQMWQRLHQPQLAANAVTTRIKSRLLLALISQLLPLVEQIADYDKGISRLFLTHPDSGLFGGLSGVGKRLAPRFLAAEWGDERDCYSANSSVQALAGGLCQWHLC